jgi:hypothetical protein
MSHAVEQLVVWCLNLGRISADVAIVIVIVMLLGQLPTLNMAVVAVPIQLACISPVMTCSMLSPVILPQSGGGGTALNCLA